MYIKGALRSCWAVRTSDPLRRRGFALTVSGRDGLPMPWSSRCGSGVLPVQGIGTGQKVHTRQRKAIAAAQCPLPVALTVSAVIGRQDQHQSGPIAGPRRTAAARKMPRSLPRPSTSVSTELRLLGRLIQLPRLSMPA